MIKTASTHQAVEQIVRNEWGRVLAALIARVRDFEIAEDALQDALIAALDSWPKNGLPDSPAAWLLAAAKRKAIDRFRRNKTALDKSPELQAMAELEQQAAEYEPDTDMAPAIEDERLRLIFTCCHPALPEPSRVALTLKSITGMTTPEIARSFLTNTETMAQRLVRAKRKIKATNIPYVIPGPELWPERLKSVLAVIYLVFNEGYAASEGEELIRQDLCSEAIRLGRLLHNLMPRECEVSGLLALMQLHASRQKARRGKNGELITLEHQNRNIWDQELIKSGSSLLITTLTMATGKGSLGPYQIQAAISAVHAGAATYDATNWQEITLLYEKLYAFQPTPVVQLNAAVALSFARGAEAGLAAIEGLCSEKDMAKYQPYHATRADMLRRAGRYNDAAAAYNVAIELSANRSERAFLQQRLAELKDGGKSSVN